MRAGKVPTELYRAEFEGATPQVRLRDGRVIVQYRGLPFDWRKRQATLGLNTTIPWTIELVGGIQRVEADLREIQLARFELTGGIETILLKLGEPRGETPVRIVGSASTIRVERPLLVPVRLTNVGGSAQTTLDGTRLGAQRGRTTVESPGWGRATDRYDVEIIGGARTIEVVGRG